MPPNLSGSTLVYPRFAFLSLGNFQDCERLVVRMVLRRRLAGESIQVPEYRVHNGLSGFLPGVPQYLGHAPSYYWPAGFSCSVIPSEQRTIRSCGCIFSAALSYSHFAKRPSGAPPRSNARTSPFRQTSGRLARALANRSWRRCACHDDSASKLTLWLSILLSRSASSCFRWATPFANRWRIRFSGRSQSAPWRSALSHAHNFCVRSPTSTACLHRARRGLLPPIMRSKRRPRSVTRAV
jgi:hypothetical protein